MISFIIPALNEAEAIEFTVDTICAAVNKVELINKFTWEEWFQPGNGFDVKSGAGNATFIDAHGHHNSDHGLDFVEGGKPASISPDPNIRVFYSSANYGRNFFKGGGDKSGFKIDDHVEQAERSGKDVRTRLIYGSVACRNPKVGFTKPGKTKLIFIGNQSSGNKHNGVTGRNYHRKVPISASPFKNKKVNDPYILKCKDFKKVKKFRSFDIPLDLK